MWRQLQACQHTDTTRDSSRQDTTGRESAGKVYVDEPHRPRKVVARTDHRGPRARELGHAHKASRDPAAHASRNPKRARRISTWTCHDRRMSGQSAVKSWSEAWFSARRCPRCTGLSMRIIDEPARDVVCDSCGEYYEVKASSNPAASSAAAGALTAYESRFATTPPNLVLIVYRTGVSLSARRVVVVPRTIVDTNLLVPRRPSTLHSGRVVRLCSLRIGDVPELARLPIHIEGCDVLPSAVAGELARWHTLTTSSSQWHRDVLRMIGWLNKPAFTRRELLQFQPWLVSRFPQARTPDQTLSRVLQELRDAGVLEFVRRGEYRLRAVGYR